MNLKKTKAMVFGTKNMQKMTRHYNIFIGGDVIHYVHIFNYLGIKLDGKLDFESHANKCLRLVSIVSRIRNIINKEQAVIIYKSKILPYFDYGDIFYNKTYSRTLDKLQKLQNRAMRLVLDVTSDIMSYYYIGNLKFSNLNIEDRLIYSILYTHVLTTKYTWTSPISL